MSANEQFPMHAVIFSLVDGAVWASWPGKNGSMELGQLDAVTYMMRDFLAQCDLSENMGVGKTATG